jgi:hypothetical protein
MRRGFLGCVSALLASAPLVYGQLPKPSAEPATPAPPVVQPVPAEKSAADMQSLPATADSKSSHDLGLPPDALPVDEPTSRFWVAPEYLHWWTKKMSLPPLVTTGPVSNQGAIGLPGTVVLFGAGSDFHEEGRDGIRLNAGMWLDCDKCWDIDANGFWFPERKEEHVFNGICGFLARPFFNINVCQETAEITSQPGLANGVTTVSTPTRFSGAELNLSKKLCCGCCYRIDFLAGFRYLELEESVNLTEFIVVNKNLPGFPEFQQFAGDTIVVTDHFGTRNQFYGGQAGIDAAYSYGNWQFEFRGKLALGNTHETISISGNQVVTTPAGVQTVFTGGLLALPSNIGNYQLDHFSAVPEATINVGYRFSDCCCVYVGYNFLYWSRVARAADQIDRFVDTSQIPNFPQSTMPTGLNRPAVTLKQSDFYAQGINVGIEFTW